MPITTFDGKDYDYDSLPSDAKAQLLSLKVVDQTLVHHREHGAVLQADRDSYAAALRKALVDIPSITPNPGTPIPD